MLVYREEIDGLRAVAVLPVIFYHGGFHTFFAGGYVGVDIFFVISGYLITSVIEGEFEDQTFSLVNFYERRCRRILPALFLILFISTPFAYYSMLPEQLYEYGQSLISIIGLSSNFFYWWKDDGYFAKLTELNPLVHTWSLAVEEQFYFVFPLLCYFFNNKKRYLRTILMGFALLSFFLAQWGGNLQSTGNDQFQMFAQHSWASFYLPGGRVWELLLGAFTAFYMRTQNPTRYVCQGLFSWLCKG
jgi:peptidoglycan/LPS O-acetylase OafA/YrhL